MPESMRCTNANLIRARQAKNDEFYTRLEDIEAEMAHYKGLFRGKAVYCNCDDPFQSNFVRYFASNFRRLGIAKLTATCYRGPHNAGRKALKAVVTAVPEGGGGSAMMPNGSSKTAETL